MTVTDSLVKISDWLNDNVCNQFKFKAPPEVNQPMDDKYVYQEVNPHAFPLFIPTRDKLPPGVITNMPSVIVQLIDGNDNLSSNKRDLNINLGFSCWNPGTHSKDIYYPKGTRPEEPEPYKSGMNGWMDAWNFIDCTLRKLESMTNIDGLYILPEVPIKFGPYKEQEAIPDLYPHWFAWIQFTVRSDFLRNNEQIEEFL